MMAAEQRHDEIVRKLEEELQSTKRELQMVKKKLHKYELQDNGEKSETTHLNPMKVTSKLTNKDIARYSRQLILPEIGVKGQLNLSNSSVLIVGAGGLGCPSAIYLAAAGIGRIGIVDYDSVEVDNLHRQILHTEQTIGQHKSDSMSVGIQRLNSTVECIPYHMQLTRDNALDIISKYDIVLDCTDNVATRYLLNDACILSGKPLVSGSALRFEGQLTVYNYEGGPCYRCLYPKPPPAETVTNCSEGGVLGVIPGIIGCMQALEALKIAAGLGSSYSQKLLVFDGLDGTFRTIKLRGRQTKCAACGNNPTVTSLINYVEFCGAGASDKCMNLNILGAEDRISVQELSQVIEHDAEKCVLLDVRLPVEFDICRLPKFINIPIKELESEISLDKLQHVISQRSSGDKTQVFVVCRRGNDSQNAVVLLKDKLAALSVRIRDVKGGLYAWTKHIDSDFPKY
ncbi:adenylyltransferase and sulfurtransferase MOCS3-like [Amphiura filiformis]|uniref:adenylyltransferase and sulfurtransferase MOCS3-like n=1 Tax=Amphiura filiformis TaxID=82378 RepID=UPI003B21BDD3